MDIISKLTFKSRIKKLGKLKTDFVLNKMVNRDEYISFLNDANKMKDIDINGIYGDVYMPQLFVACLMNDFELFKLLIHLGANEELKYGEMVICDMIVTNVHNIQFYKYLNDKKYDFLKETCWGTTPIFININNIGCEEKAYYKKSENRYLEMIKVFEFLLSKNVDINNGGNKIISPLMLAARFSSPILINMLLKNGADKNKKYFIPEYNSEMNCLDFYKKYIQIEKILENKEILELLI